MIFITFLFQQKVLKNLYSKDKLFYEEPDFSYYTSFFGRLPLPQTLLEYCLQNYLMAFSLGSKSLELFSCHNSSSSTPLPIKYFSPYTSQKQLFSKIISAIFQIHIHLCYCTKSLGLYNALS